MFSKIAAKSAPKPVATTHHVSFARNLLVLVMSMVVAVLISLSLWIAANAIFEKIKVGHGMEQIIDIVEVSRRIAGSDPSFAATPREDVLGRLAKMRQIQAAGDSNGLQTIANPWGGTVVAFALPPAAFRVETVVPSRVCIRIVNLLAPALSSLGLRQIDAKSGDEAWRQVFVAGGSASLSQDQILAGCHGDQQVILDLTFTLR